MHCLMIGMEMLPKIVRVERETRSSSIYRSIIVLSKMYYCSSKNSFDFSLLLYNWNTYLGNIKNLKNESNLRRENILKLLRKENLKINKLMGLLRPLLVLALSIKKFNKL